MTNRECGIFCCDVWNWSLLAIINVSRGADVCCDTDVDECAVNNGGCSLYADCTNTPGNYNCTCIEGYDGDGFNCSGKAHRKTLSFRAVLCNKIPKDSLVVRTFDFIQYFTNDVLRNLLPHNSYTKCDKLSCNKQKCGIFCCHLYKWSSTSTMNVESMCVVIQMLMSVLWITEAAVHTLTAPTHLETTHVPALEDTLATDSIA